MHYLSQRRILVNLILLTLVWTSATFNYYMINLQVKHFPGHITLNVLVLMGTDVPASILSGFLFSRYPVKTLFLIFYAMQSIAGISILLLVKSSSPMWLFPVLVSIARFGDTSCYAGIWIAHPRMFPTLFSVTSMGVASFFSRGFVILAPMVAEIAYPIPIIVFVCLTTTSGLTSMFLIENEPEKDEAVQSKKHDDAVPNDDEIDQDEEDIKLLKEKAHKE